MYAGNSADNPFLAILLMISFTVIVILIWKRGLKKVELHYQKDKLDAGSN
ncbi:MAG: hypothetical protein NT127_02845 [Sphingobacteriales bacterium]|nr:hypothetical protein [Sphingobacteriales bacterium]